MTITGRPTGQDGKARIDYVLIALAIYFNPMLMSRGKCSNGRPRPTAEDCVPWDCARKYLIFTCWLWPKPSFSATGRTSALRPLRRGVWALTKLFDDNLSSYGTKRKQKKICHAYTPRYTFQPDAHVAGKMVEREAKDHGGRLRALGLRARIPNIYILVVAQKIIFFAHGPHIRSLLMHSAPSGGDETF